MPPEPRPTETPSIPHGDEESGPLTGSALGGKTLRPRGKRQTSPMTRGNFIRLTSEGTGLAGLSGDRIVVAQP